MTAINKMQVWPIDDRENGNFEEGVPLKAFAWRQLRFFSPTLLKDQVM